MSSRRGLFHVRELKDIGQSMSGVDNGLPGLGPPTAADSMFADPNAAQVEQT
jgi:hypothetical protein